MTGKNQPHFGKVTLGERAGKMSGNEGEVRSQTLLWLKIWEGRSNRSEEEREGSYLSV